MACSNKENQKSIKSTAKLNREQIKRQQAWIYESNKLNKRYDVIEKQLQSIYRDGNPLSMEFKDIFDWNQLMHADRIRENNENQKYLMSTSNLVNKFEILLNNISSKDEKSLNEMDSIAEQIEDKLMNFKTNHKKKLQDLENAEKILWTELDTTTQRLDTFEKDVNVKITDSSRPSTAKFAKKRALNKTTAFGNNENDSRPPKLIEVQKQIDEHGQYGGWPQRDHQDFLKLYSQIASDKDLLHRLSEVMPQYTLSELREHLTWFDHYERLWEYKRKIIAEWKESKKKQKELQSKAASKYNEKAKQDKLSKFQKQKEELERKRKLVKEWREQKDQEEYEQNIAKEEAIKREKLKKQKLYKQRRREQKALLLEQAERKKLNELVKKTEVPNRNLKVIKNSERNKKLLMKFRTKDMLIVSKKREALNRKEQEERDREWRMVNLIAKSQPMINVKSDKQRLFKMTAAAKKRKELKSKEKKTKGSRSLGFTENAVRSVPSWRKGL